MRSQPSRSFRRRRAAFAFVTLVWLGALVFGDWIEDTIGLPLGSGSTLLLLVLAAYTAVVHWLLPHLEEREALDRMREEKAVPAQDPETVEKALARVAARRAAGSAAGLTAEAPDGAGPTTAATEGTQAIDRPRGLSVPSPSAREGEPSSAPRDPA